MAIEFKQDSRMIPGFDFLKNLQEDNLLAHVREYRDFLGSLVQINLPENFNILETSLIENGTQILYKIEDLEGDIYNGKKPIFLNIYDLDTQEMKVCSPLLPEGWKILDVEFVDEKKVLYKFENSNEPIDYKGSAALGIALYDIESNLFLDEGISIPSASLIKDIQIDNNEILLLLKNFQKNNHTTYRYTQKGFQETDNISYNVASSKILPTHKKTDSTEVISLQDFEEAA